MKIQITETTVKEVEVAFPCYRKFKTKLGYLTVAKITNEKHSVLVRGESIESFNFFMDNFLGETYEDATKEEFDTQFDKTMEYLQTLK